MLSFLVCAHSSPITAGSAFAKMKLYPIACMKPEGQRGSKFQIHKLQRFELLSLLPLHASQIAAGSMQPQQPLRFSARSICHFPLRSGRVATPAMRLHPHRKQEPSASSFPLRNAEKQVSWTWESFSNFEFIFSSYDFHFSVYCLVLFSQSHLQGLLGVVRGLLERMPWQSRNEQWHAMAASGAFDSACLGCTVQLQRPQRSRAIPTERTGHRMDVGTHKTSVAPRHSGYRPCQNSFIAGAGRLGTRGARVLEDKSKNSKFPNEPEILNESFCILGIWPHLSRTGWKCQETWKPRMHQNHCIGWIQCFS